VKVPKLPKALDMPSIPLKQPSAMTMRKIIDGLAIASFVLVVGTLGTVSYGYYWVTSNQDKLTEIVMDQVKEALPGMVSGALPDLTGGALPSKSSKKGRPNLPF